MTLLTPTLLDVREIENVAVLSVTCAQCGTQYLVEVDYEGYLSWTNGHQLLQFALPQSTQDERELLLSGTCGPCYDSLFDFGEEDDD